MKFRRELAYEAAPAEVFAMIADPAFREKVGAAQDVASISVTIEPAADGLTIVVDQEQNTAGLPAIAKKIAGDTTRAITTERWRDQSIGDYTIDVPGKPTGATGSVAIEADGSGTRYVLEIDVKVKVPLVAGKLEKIMANQIDEGLDAEHRVGMAWLRGN